MQLTTVPPISAVLCPRETASTNASLSVIALRMQFTLIRFFGISAIAFDVGSPQECSSEKFTLEIKTEDVNPITTLMDGEAVQLQDGRTAYISYQKHDGE